MVAPYAIMLHLCIFPEDTMLRCGDGDGVISMAQESDMPSESGVAAVLEAGDAAVATFCLCCYQRQLKSS